MNRATMFGLLVGAAGLAVVLSSKGDEKDCIDELAEGLARAYEWQLLDMSQKGGSLTLAFPVLAQFFEQNGMPDVGACMRDMGGPNASCRDVMVAAFKREFRKGIPPMLKNYVPAVHQLLMNAGEKKAASCLVALTT